MAGSYLELLRCADEHFQRTLAEQRRNLQCRRGCTLCCYGLFEIGAADVAMMADGLVQLDLETRRNVTERAEEVLRTTNHSDLRDLSGQQKEVFFARTANVPCPALGESGECLLYEHRPLVCRTFGLPGRDGGQYIGEECELNFTAALRGEKENAAWDLKWEDAVGSEDQYTVAEAIVLAARILEKSRGNRRAPAPARVP